VEGESDGVVAVSRDVRVDVLCVVLLTFLIRTTRSDWLAWEVAREPLERAYFVSS
jgi:hypothetical protein